MGFESLHRMRGSLESKLTKAPFWGTGSRSIVVGDLLGGTGSTSATNGTRSAGLRKL